MSRDPHIAIDISTLDGLAGPGGQARYVIDLVNGLSELERPATFVVLGSRPEPLTAISRVFGERPQQWSYRQLRPVRLRAADLLEPMRRGWVCRRARVDVFHATHSHVPLFAGCPIVVTLYDLMYEIFPEYEPYVRTRAHRVFRWSVRHVAQHIVSISECTKNDAITCWGIPRDRISVVPLGTRFDAGASDGPGEATDRPRLLSMYNLEPRKNLETLLEAVALAQSDFPDLELQLVGRAAITSDRERKFARAVAQLGLTESIVLLGVVTDEELRELYGTATMFVFPTLYEGFGLPLVEAMASGACVVARSASALAEVVGEAGLLVETSSASVLAEGIVGLLRDPERRRELRARARPRGRTFSVRRMAEMTFDVYQRALD